MKKTKFIIDCEFNSSRGQLLSMALVPVKEGIEPFYEELAIIEPLDPWVIEHVMPSMRYAVDNNWRHGLSTFQMALEAYLDQFEEVQIIVDWPDDIAYFCNVLITTPGQSIKLPKLTFKIVPITNEKSKDLHNALADAEAMRLDYIQKFQKEVQL